MTNYISPELFNQIIQKSIKIGSIIIGAYIVQKITIITVKKLIKKDKPRVKTLVSLIKESTRIVINFIALLLILTELGFDILPLITGAGIVGLAIGMGAKSLASDLITGIFFLIENRFNVDDIIEAGSKKGKVVKIDLRTITLKSDDGNIHIIPNSSISTITKIK